MRIELKGGPFDGHIIPDGVMDKIMVVDGGTRPRPIYKCAFCDCCAHESETVDYQFVGYESITIVKDSDTSFHVH